jgi:hypothetical protein
MSIEAAARQARQALQPFANGSTEYLAGGIFEVTCNGADLINARAAIAALDAALAATPKPLDDPRLQGLFSDAISGALAFGAQNTNPPPAGHWLERFWQMGRAALSEGPQKERPDFIAGYDAGLIDGRACAARDAAPPAAEPVEHPMSQCPGCGMEFADGALHDSNLANHLLRKELAALKAVPQTEPPLDCDNPTYQRGYCDGQAYVIGTCAKFLKDGEMPHERMERDHLDTLALMGLLAAEKRKNEAPQTEKDAARYRWLRDDYAPPGKDCPAVYMMEAKGLLVGEDLDEAVDAAMGQPK